MTVKRHTLAPFRFRFYIGIGWDDYPQFCRLLGCNAEEARADHANSDAITHRQNATMPLRLGVWLNEGILTNGWERVVKPFLPGVIAHEAVHVWDYIVEAIHESAKTDELSAYFIQQITNLVWQEALRRIEAPA